MLGGSGRIAPTVDDNGPIVIGGDDAGPGNNPIIITGTATPGSDVVVQIGDEVIESTSDDNGDWTVTFDGDDFPEDGDYAVDVTVTEPDGTETGLTGPNVVIDTTPPDTSLLEGAVDTGDIVNAEEYDAGFEITGEGDPGASVSVTIESTTHETVVDGSGSWAVTFAPGDVPTGE